MLILNRKVGQSILITNEIQIIILNATGDIRLGIEAPKEMQILRSEIAHHYCHFAKTLPQIIHSHGK